MFKCLVINHNEKEYTYIHIFVAQQKLTLYKSTIFQKINKYLKIVSSGRKRED